MKSEMGDSVFRCFLGLFMEKDSSERKSLSVIEDMLSDESKRRGFSGWVDAFLYYEPDETGRAKETDGV